MRPFIGSVLEESGGGGIDFHSVHPLEFTGICPERNTETRPTFPGIPIDNNTFYTAGLQQAPARPACKRFIPDTDRALLDAAGSMAVTIRSL